MKEKKKISKGLVYGYILIILGICLPLYAFTRLSISSLTSEKKYEDFVSQLDDQAPENIEELQEGIEKYNRRVAGSNDFIDPFIDSVYEAVYDFYDENPDQVFAYMDIPKLDLKKPVFLGASHKHLRDGLGHIYGTSMPVGGKGTRSVISGHRGTYTDIMFLNLDQLEEGDMIYLDLGYERLEYRVSDSEVIHPDNWTRLQPIADMDILTLLTCDPLTPPRPNRLLVNAIRLEEEEEELVAESEEKEAAKEDSLDENKEREKSSSFNRSKFFNYLIYAITIIGYLALIWVLIKFGSRLRN